jgi:putative glycerol-1-phosphate prenyltransferase
MMPVYQSLVDKKKNGQKSFAVLIDPDKVSTSSLHETISLATQAKVDYFLVGGSLVISDHLDACIQLRRSANRTMPYFIYHLFRAAMQII